jgi:hypothetical protein
VTSFSGIKLIQIFGSPVYQFQSCRRHSEMHAGLPYVCPMNLVSIFDRSRCCIVRVCGVARGSHVGYILNLLRCRELRLFTADWKDVTTGLLFACIGFFVVLGYRLQNIRSPCWKGAMCAVHGISQRCQDHGHFILLVV